MRQKSVSVCAHSFIKLDQELDRLWCRHCGASQIGNGPVPLPKIERVTVPEKSSFSVTDSLPARMSAAEFRERLKDPEFKKLVR